MNTVDNADNSCKENINNKNSNLAKGFEQTVDGIEKSVGKATDFMIGKAHDASCSVSKGVDNTISAVSEGLEAGKHYLTDRNLEGMSNDFTGIIKKYPIQSMLAGIAVGVLISNSISRN
jgi:hypothetical protein